MRDDEVAEASAAGQAAHRRRFDGRRLRRLGFAAVAAAALITLGTLFGISRQPDDTLRFDPNPATAREVIESALAVTGAAESLQGLMVGGEVRNGEFIELTRFTVVLTADGRIARRYLPSSASTAASLAASSTPVVTGPGPGQGPVYVPSLPIVRYDSVYLPDEWSSHDVAVTSEPPPNESSTSSPELTAYSDEQSSLASGWPFCDAAGRLLPYLRLRSYMRALLSGEAPDMRDITFAGRDAWELTTVPRPARRVVPSGGESAATALDDATAVAPMTIVVDKETRVPLAFRWREPRRGELELRMLDVRLDAGLDAAAFDLQVPEDAVEGDPEPGETTALAAFTPIDLADKENASETLGGMPGYPAWRPQGFSLADSTTARLPIDPYEAMASSAWPLPDDLTAPALSLAFRRGSDAFAVSVGPAAIGFDGDGPYSRFLRLHTTRLRLVGGAFDGSPAELVLDPGFVPQLRVDDDTHLATVSGDLSPAEMVKVAESLGAPWMEE